MRFISLFAGIGGMDLGLERAGMQCVAQVEIDEYASKVLAKHWPDVVRFRDVRDVGAHNLPAADLIAGGFPCQDLSYAGKGAGIDGERSGLWSEFYRIICEVRPRFVLVENVAALLNRGIERVLGDLAASGYDAEWDCVPAAAVGAPHLRDRLFIVAYTACDGWDGRHTATRRETRPEFAGGCADGRQNVAYAQEQSNRAGLCAHESPEVGRRRFSDGSGAHHLSDAAFEQLQGQRAARQQVAEAFRVGRIFGGRGCHARQWAVEPDVGRVANGIPCRVDRLKGLGNAVVPAVAQFIGERIMECHSASTPAQD